MVKIIAAIVLIGMLIGLGWGIHNSGYDSGVADEKVAQAEITKEAVKKARAEEQEKQEKTNDATQIQFNELATINDNLTNSISRLRKRANRQHLPKDAKANCSGTTGASLSAEDGEFLVRESARADKIRAALKACYTYADTVGKTKKSPN